MANPTISLETLTANAKERADLTDSSFISDANWYMLINRARRDLFRLICSSNEQFFEKTATGSTVVDQEDYTLPASDASDGTFFRMLEAEIQDASGNWRSMSRYRQADRNILRNDANLLASTFSEYFYDIQGNTLRILPAPTAVRTYRLRYIPYPLDLVASPSSPNTLTLQEEFCSDYIEVCAAIWARIKAEKDVTEYRKERTHLRQHVLDLSKGRDRGASRVMGGGRMPYTREFTWRRRWDV